MNLFEKRVFKERTIRKIELFVKKENSDIRKFEDLFKSQDIKIISTGFERRLSDTNDKVVFLVGVTTKINIQELCDSLEEQTGIVSIKVDILE